MEHCLADRPFPQLFPTADGVMIQAPERPEAYASAPAPAIVSQRSGAGVWKIAGTTDRRGRTALWKNLNILCGNCTMAWPGSVGRFARCWACTLIWGNLAEDSRLQAPLPVWPAAGQIVVAWKAGRAGMRWSCGMWSLQLRWRASSSFTKRGLQAGRRSVADTGRGPRSARRLGAACRLVSACPQARLF